MTTTCTLLATSVGYYRKTDKGATELDDALIVGLTMFKRLLIQIICWIPAIHSCVAFVAKATRPRSLSSVSMKAKQTIAVVGTGAVGGCKSCG
jgi:hypothetical protein